MIIATASANVDDVVAADARNDELGGNVVCFMGFTVLALIMILLICIGRACDDLRNL